MLSSAWSTSYPNNITTKHLGPTSSQRLTSLESLINKSRGKAGGLELLANTAISSKATLRWWWHALCLNNALDGILTLILALTLTLTLTPTSLVFAEVHHYYLLI